STNYNGADSFSYKANDGTADSNTVVVSLTVNAVNDAPVNTVPGQQTVSEDGELVFSVATGNAISISDVDVNGSPVRVMLAGTNGVLTLATTGGLTFGTGDGTADATMTFTGTLADINAALDGLTFTPPANYAGPAWVTIVTSDLGNTGSGGPQTATDNVAITVTPVNDAPVAVGDSYATAEDTPLTVAGPGVLANDTDVEGNPLTAVLVSGPAHGALTLNADGSFTYTPSANYNGADSFSYKANDGQADSNTIVVNLTVDAVNDAPVLTGPGTVTTGEDTPLVLSAATGNGTAVADVDAGSGLVQVTLTASNGTLSLSGIQGLTFAAGDGSADTTMTFAGTVTDVNAALDGLTFAPAANFNGTATIDVVVNDQGNTGSGGALTAVETVQVQVTAVNDAPVATGDSYATSEDTPLTVAGPGVLANDTDVDVDSLAAVLVAGPAHGTLTLNADGSFTYTPDANYNGADSFTYQANDGTADSNAVVVTLTVQAVNDAPVLAPSEGRLTQGERLTLMADQLTGAAVDVDGDALTVVVVRPPAHGQLIAGPDGAFVYVPDRSFAGVDSFLYKVSDGQVDSNVVTVGLTVDAALPPALGAPPAGPALPGMPMPRTDPGRPAELPPPTPATGAGGPASGAIITPVPLTSPDQANGHRGSPDDPLPLAASAGAHRAVEARPADRPARHPGGDSRRRRRPRSRPSPARLARPGRPGYPGAIARRGRRDRPDRREQRLPLARAGPHGRTDGGRRRIRPAGDVGDGRDHRVGRLCAVERAEPVVGGRPAAVVPAVEAVRLSRRGQRLEGPRTWRAHCLGRGRGRRGGRRVRLIRPRHRCDFRQNRTARGAAANCELDFSR
ncbi:MAG: tandem-95 repeat protein, partial [Gemmataceae bacterium]